MQEKQPLPTGGTIADFAETPYVDQSWEIVGEAVAASEFEPMEFETFRTAAIGTDPMFEDYGGGIRESGKKRWHLPEELAHAAQQAARKSEVKDAPEIPMISVAEAERLSAEAYERGKAEGAAAAEAAHTDRFSQLAAQVETLLQDLQAQLNEELMALERQSVGLAMSVAEKLVGTAVEINPEYIEPVLNEALALAKGAAIRKVRVSPQDMEFVEVVGIEKKLRSFDGTWTFEADATIKSGCIVETSAGEIDFQLDRAWERIQGSVMKAVR